MRSTKEKKKTYKYKVWHINEEEALIIIADDPLKALLEAKSKWPWQDLHVELISNLPVSNKE